jgi:hypothetical protein
MNALTQRALRAYFRAEPDGDQPGGGNCVETAENGRTYVVLRGGRSGTGICAVYSVRTGEKLRRLRRYPADLVWERFR